LLKFCRDVKERESGRVTSTLAEVTRWTTALMALIWRVLQLAKVDFLAVLSADLAKDGRVESEWWRQGIFLFFLDSRS
jgi:hypothetical protein